MGEGGIVRWGCLKCLTRREGWVSCSGQGRCIECLHNGCLQLRRVLQYTGCIKSCPAHNLHIHSSDTACSERAPIHIAHQANIITCTVNMLLSYYCPRRCSCVSWRHKSWLLCSSFSSSNRSWVTALLLNQLSTSPWVARQAWPQHQALKALLSAGSSSSSKRCSSGRRCSRRRSRRSPRRSRGRSRCCWQRPRARHLHLALTRLSRRRRQRRYVEDWLGEGCFVG